LKWTDKTKLTKLIKIEWKNSRTGIITPVAIFDSVDIDGTKVSRASLHNLSNMENLKLGIGDKIKVYKANMIVPQIAENLTKSNNFKIPDKCFSCGKKTKIIINNKTKFLICENDFCKDKIIASLEHYVSRDAMNIIGLSKESIKKLVEEKFLNNFFDIYKLKNFEQEICYAGIFDKKDLNNTHKAYKKIIKSIEKSKSSQTYRFLYALGIDNIGLNTAKIICENFNNNIDLIINANLEELNLIDTVGETISTSIINYFKNKKILEMINKILLEINLF
jgi:DNA ligase (NAD+)